jgi:hypothetical protein
LQNLASKLRLLNCVLRFHSVVLGFMSLLKGVPSIPSIERQADDRKRAQYVQLNSNVSDAGNARRGVRQCAHFESVIVDLRFAK